MTTNKNDPHISSSYHDYILDNSTTIDIRNIDTTLYYNTDNTMYYTSNTGTIDTITLDESWRFNDIMWPFKEFENTMPELTKIKEMCTMYPAMEKAFENFKAIYDLVKDDYEERKNSDL